jgi:hypothetical protein
MGERENVLSRGCKDAKRRWEERRREESRETAKALCHATPKKQEAIEVGIPNGWRERGTAE